jgi:phage-related protein
VNTAIDLINELIGTINKIPGVEVPLIAHVEVQRNISSIDYMDEEVGNVGNNAAGTDNWRGGLTWIGEQGPELVNLPRGAQVYNHNESMAMAGSGRVSSLESKLSGVNNNSSFAPVFSPQIIVQGNADEGTVAKVMKMSFDEFKRFMKQYENDKNRLQFSPS